MGTIAFSDYISSRPAAVTPLDDADRIIVVQGGTVKQVPSSDTGNTVETIQIDATITPITSLPASGEVVYRKSDDSATPADFDVSVVGQSIDVSIQPLEGQGNTIRVKLIGTTWYKIG